ncbi:hypothetical protein WJX75_006130 [Coccomyxa subellipsoidea]|uniref:Uncharacterized protein n=1 Tax=Coccomyxa subellipsoidea TaxID=248742 RepID=A0ABR2YHZ5_9CHLO
MLASAPQQAPVKVQLQGQAVSRLTKALLEANDRIYKFNTTSVSPAETPAASEQLCGPARPLQAGAVEVVSATQQPYTSHIGLCGNQHQAERDISDTASETGSSSTPPPRKGRRRTAMCRNTHTKAAARKLQPPPAPAFRPAQTPFPWARTTTSKLVQRLLAMQAPDRSLGMLNYDPPLSDIELCTYGALDRGKRGGGV